MIQFVMNLMSSNRLSKQPLKEMKFLKIGRWHQFKGGGGVTMIIFTLTT